MEFDQQEWPEWLEQNRICSPDGVYDLLEPELRARLKSQIAFMHHYWGERGEDLTRRASWLDRMIYDDQRPLGWVLFLFDRVYASAVEMLAAVMPAVLARTPEILACRVGLAADIQSPPDTPDAPKDNRFGPLPLLLAAAFELIGQEQLWDIDGAEAVRLIADLEARSGPGNGCVVIMGSASTDGGSSWMMKAAWAAIQHNVDCLTLPGRVKIAVDESCAADFELLRWSHPQADIYSVSPKARLEICNALVTEEPAQFHGGETPDQAGHFRPPLCLQPGNEAFWAWPSFSPDIFRQRRIGVYNRPTLPDAG